MSKPTYTPYPVAISNPPTVIGVQNRAEAINTLVIAVQMGLTCAYQPIDTGTDIQHLVLVDVPYDRTLEFKAKLEMIS